LFTGLVGEIGKVETIKRTGGSITFEVRAPRLASRMATGDSVAVNGACQTVTEAGGGAFRFVAVAETLGRTNLGRLKQGSRVNLEMALRLGDRLGGHLVSGHVDCTAIIRSRRLLGRDNVDFGIQVAEEYGRFIISKGSICLDGVSLTVKAVRGSVVEVTVIPYTLGSTIISDWRVGSVVNVEVDQVAKYLMPRIRTMGGGTK
jgi:riboflavin synthase